MKKLFLLLFFPLLVACGDSSSVASNEGTATTLEASAKDDVVLKATPTAIEMYGLLQESLHQKTTELVAKEYFKDYTDQMWLDFLKVQDQKYGKVASYQLIDSEATSYEDGTKSATLIFEVKRDKMTVYERVNLIQSTEQSEFLVEGLFLSENKEDIYVLGK